MVDGYHFRDRLAEDAARDLDLAALLWRARAAHRRGAWGAGDVEVLADRETKVLLDHSEFDRGTIRQLTNLPGNRCPIFHSIQSVHQLKVADFKITTKNEWSNW